MPLNGPFAKYRTWTPDEDEALRRSYPSGYRAAMAAVPGRTRASIFQRAKKIGVTTHRRWGSSDDKQLIDLWDAGIDIRSIAKRMDRTQMAIYWRAMRLALPLGCPDGFEYVSAAAVRSGYDLRTLRKILSWAGVTMRRALCPVSITPRASHRKHFVSPEDVDDAIAKWHDTEPLERAARRVGVCGETLRRWLAAIGVTNEGRAAKTCWRVNTADVTRAVAARQGITSLPKVAEELAARCIDCGRCGKKLRRRLCSNCYGKRQAVGRTLPPPMRRAA